MFTGIVEFLGEVRQVVAEPPGRRLVIEHAVVAAGSARGESIAVNGVCLTVADIDAGRLVFQVGPETIRCTDLGELAPGQRVNLERSLQPSTRIGGHFVLGHVDGVGRIASRRRENEWEWVQFAAEPSLLEQMVPKGSVAVDGVSLTIVGVAGEHFTVMLIPHTLANTTLGFKSVGATVNIETDILGKYVWQALRGGGAARG